MALAKAGRSPLEARHSRSVGFVISAVPFYVAQIETLPDLRLLCLNLIGATSADSACRQMLTLVKNTSPLAGG
jgi:hypothetical protein